MKKSLMILVCCMVFLSIPITAYAAKDETSTYEYEVRDGKAVLTRYATDSNATRITVPQEVDGYEVIGLEGTFKENQRLEKIEIPEGIEYLGMETFLKCRKLKNIKLPDTLTEIGTHCFERSNISEIKIPDSVENIGYGTFVSCGNLREINLENLNITEIGFEMFDGCSKLKKVTLPNSVEVINSGAFSGCMSLNEIRLSDSLIKIESWAFRNCSNLKSINLPLSLEKIGVGAFNYCDLIEELIIPPNVSQIDSDDYGVISGKNLKRIVNQTNIDFDKTVYYDVYLEYIWYLSETGDEIAEFLPANSTIYRRKVENKPVDPDNPSDDKEKIKIQEMELSITCTKPNENISPENLAVDFKTEHCHVKEINVTRYNKANIIIVPDDGYVFSKVIDEWANISGIDVEIERVRARNSTSGNVSEIQIAVINAASIEPSEGDSTQILFDKYTDSISNEIEKIRKEKIKMSDANSEESVKEYITQRLSKFSNDIFEYEVVVDNEDFRVAEAGTAKIPKGKNGSCHITVRMWEKDNKETLIKIMADITIKPTEYETSSRGGSGGSSGGSSSGGDSSSKSESSSNAINIIITKNNIIMGIWEQIEGKWKLKASDGSYASSQWAMLGGKWYLLGADGFMLTGWQMVNGKWYLFGQDGSMLSGWQFINGKWYYLGADGAMLAGTVTPDGYIVNENGEWIQ